MYVHIIDAKEDCFDCFNRSKDNSGGAQTLSKYQIFEKQVDEQEQNVRVAILKSLDFNFGQKIGQSVISDENIMLVDQQDIVIGGSEIK